MIDIIIPIYNTPINDLKRCFKSIINSTYKKYQVILIDDGSTNEIKKFLDNYTKDKENFKVYHIPNGGVSNARNLGIELSDGEYIAFVDSDDTIASCFLEEAYNLITKNNLDIVIGGYNEIKNDEIIKTRKCEDGFHLYNEENLHLFKDKLISSKLKHNNKEINDAPIGRIYSRLYKRSILKLIKFNSSVNLSEDTLYMIDLMQVVKQIGIVPNIWYNYYQNDYSVLHQKNDVKTIRDISVFIEEIIKRMNNERSEEIKNAYCFRIIKAIFNIRDLLEDNLEYYYQIYNESNRVIFKKFNHQDYINISSEEIEFINSIKEQ